MRLKKFFFDKQQDTDAAYPMNPFKPKSTWNPPKRNHHLDLKVISLNPCWIELGVCWILCCMLIVRRYWMDWVFARERNSVVLYLNSRIELLNISFWMKLFMRQRLRYKISYNVICLMYQCIFVVLTYFIHNRAWQRIGQSKCIFFKSLSHPVWS